MADAAAGVRSGPSGSSADPGLLAALELIAGYVARPGWAFTDGEVLENLRVLSRLQAVLASGYLQAVADLDTRPGALPGVAAGKVAATFLREALHVSGPQVGRDLRAAKALCSAEPELPVLAAALAEGAVSREHVDVAVSTVARLPKAVKTTPVVDGTTGEVVAGSVVIDEVLTGLARIQPPSTVELLGRGLIERLAPDRAGRGFDADAYQRRSFSKTTDVMGMARYGFWIDPASDVIVQSVLDAYAAPAPAGTALTEDGQTITVKDERTAGQRYADAFITLITNQGSGTTTPPTQQPGEQAAERSAGSGGQASEQGGSEGGAEGGAPAPSPCGAPVPAAFRARPFPGIETCVVVTMDQFAAAFGATDEAALRAGLAHYSLAGPVGTFTGATLAPEVTARLACDSPLRRILLTTDGAVLHYGRSQRLASTAQRRALTVRDQGCVIPGCSSPPEWCEAHHVVPWKDGGQTDIDAMVLLCSRHHTAHHTGIYTIMMRDGLPWVRVPGWVDPTRPWLRNTTHHDHHHTTTKITEQLLGRPPGPHPVGSQPGQSTGRLGGQQQPGQQAIPWDTSEPEPPPWQAA